MKSLIVTADDLGLAKSINEGIARACREGVVTAVSLIPTGTAVEDGVRIINELRLKGAGAHLALTQTRDGYLWLGTPNGLVRFDGIHCQLFDDNGKLVIDNTYWQSQKDDDLGASWQRRRSAR